MKRSVKTSLFLGAALFAACVALAFETGLRRYDLPNRDILEMELPAGWIDHVEQPEGGGPPTIEIAISEGGPNQVFVTPQWTDPTDPAIRELPALRDAIRDAAERIKPQVVESFLSATDRVQGPGEFKFMSQGALQVGTLTLWFVILANDGQDTVAVEALAALQTAVHRRTGLDQL
jgi:hypothetical protein